MNYEVLDNMLRTEFKAQVTDAVPLPTQWDNAPFPERVDGQPWCRMAVRPGEAKRISIGGDKAGNVHRVPGVMIVNVMVPVLKGPSAAHRLVDRIIPYFRDTTLVSNGGFGTDKVKFGESYATVIGKSGTEEWQHNVNCPFYFDTVAILNRIVSAVDMGGGVLRVTFSVPVTRPVSTGSGLRLTPSGLGFPGSNIVNEFTVDLFVFGGNSPAGNNLVSDGKCDWIVPPPVAMSIPVT